MLHIAKRHVVHYKVLAPDLQLNLLKLGSVRTKQTNKDRLQRPENIQKSTTTETKIFLFVL